MPFRSGGDAEAYLASRGLGAGPRGRKASTSIDYANRAERFSGAGRGFTLQDLRRHGRTPEHPGRPAPAHSAGVRASEIPRPRPPRYAQEADNGVVRAPGLRRKGAARQALREMAERGEQRGVHIVVQRKNGDWVTLTRPGGMTPGGVERLMGDFRLWKSALRDLLAGRYGKGAHEDDGDVDMDSAEMVIF